LQMLSWWAICQNCRLTETHKYAVLSKPGSDQQYKWVQASGKRADRQEASERLF
jgi:hypothetical protein